MSDKLSFLDTPGKRIKFLRERMGWSQDKLAELFDKKSGKQTISKWENDKSEPSMAEIRQLAQILDSTAGWIIDGEEVIGSVADSYSPPPGKVLMDAQEAIELYRLKTKQQQKQLEEQK